jgi:hypothetical protein
MVIYRENGISMRGVISRLEGRLQAKSDCSISITLCLQIC